ncbi:MAG: radical SAM/SPASM domain-containing protein [Armatimonadota bacterium]
MVSREVVKQRFIYALLPLIERALLNDNLRGWLIRELEHHILERWTREDPNRPLKVQQDKAEIVKALVYSFHRALQRRQLSATALHKLFKNYFLACTLGLDKERIEAVEAFRERHGVHPPTSVVIAPTKFCNLQCTGCYANSHAAARESLDWNILDRIVTEAKKLWGIRFFTITGGEPLLYRSQGNDILDLVAKHEECFFMMYTNGTMIDERMARRMSEAGNITPAISVEGLEERTDARRGKGVFKRILKAMANLREWGVPFGISVTATRENAEEIMSDEFIDFFFEEQRALYGWLFQYMPIGRGYTLKLLLTPEQRLRLWERTWQIVRERKILFIDFWNCGTLSDGCISAIRSGGYFYIDWSGKVMPCVFVPYSPVNIVEVYKRGGTLEDIYNVPYFQAIRQWQAEYGFAKERPEEHGNWLMPCPIRDHHKTMRELIDRFKPEPEDESAAAALQDEEYYRGMLAYNEAVKKVLDPVWEQEYLAPHRKETTASPNSLN